MAGRIAASGSVTPAGHGPTYLVAQVLHDDLRDRPSRQCDGRHVAPSALLLHRALLLGRVVAGHETKVRADVEQSFDFLPLHLGDNSADVAVDLLGAGAENQAW